MFLGCDVGSSSVRVGLFEFASGCILKKEVRNIKTWNEDDIFEQSSDDIFDCICDCIEKIVDNDDGLKVKIQGMSFDATCSLVAVSKDKNESITVSLSKDNQRNIIMWCDHRAVDETSFINSREAGQEVLQYCGGKISIEMELPKILWLKRNLPETYNNAKFFDLADYLVFKFCDQDVRSVTTNVCKWGYLAHKSEWNQTFFKSIDLNDLNVQQLTIKEPGTRVGNVTEEVTKRANITNQCLVSVGIIDAHAGGLGTLCFSTKEERSHFDILSLIGGTSTCHMATTQDAVFVKGVWGPYFNAMVKNNYLLEGGQSSSSTLLDRVVHSHSAFKMVEQEAQKKNVFVYDLLNEKVKELKHKHTEPLTKNIHIGPDFHGNRSPLADNQMTGSIIGLKLDDQTEEGLVILYYAAIQSLAYGTRAIMEAIAKQSKRKFCAIHATGGLSKNSLWIQEHADINQIVVTVSETDAVLVGASVLAVCGALNVEVEEVIQKVQIKSSDVLPDKSTKSFHDKKFNVFQQMQQDQIKYREIMK